MMSSLLLSHIKKSLKTISSSHSTNDNNESDDDNDNEDTEHPQVRLTITENTKIVQTDQVHHYIYRADTLSHLCFYDFVRNICSETKARDKRTKNTHETRVGVLKCHVLKDEHKSGAARSSNKKIKLLCQEGML